MAGTGGSDVAEGQPSKSTWHELAAWSSSFRWAPGSVSKYRRSFFFLDNGNIFLLQKNLYFITVYNRTLQVSETQNQTFH